MSIVRTFIALATLLGTVATAYAASPDSVDVARLEQELREAHYARIGIEGRTHVLTRPRAVPEGLGYAQVEKVPRHRHEIVAGAGLDGVAPLSNPVPWSRIEQIESGVRPRGRSALVGGTIGLVTGAAVGAGLEMFGLHMSGGDWNEDSWRFTLASGAIFGVVGAGIGALFPSTKWKQVYPLPKERAQR